MTRLILLGKKAVISALVIMLAIVRIGDIQRARGDIRPFAPVDRPGPPLRVPTRVLADSVRCTPNARNAHREVVLFVHGTTVTPRENFSWNWFPAMKKLGWPFCYVTEPNHAMSDAQISAEYVVFAIRHVYMISGRKVDIVGHSQGGIEPRFALRFWPDLRSMVDDYVSFAATNHGTLAADALCPPVVGCAPAIWQQRFDSNFTRAMDSYQETFPGISYTNVFTHTDEFVQPNLDPSGTSSLHGGGGNIDNVAVQDICPLDVSEHLAVGTYDPVSYAVAIDALTHAGPADPKRIPGTVCSKLFMPGVDPAQFPADYAVLGETIGRELATYPHVSSEPALAGYVYGD